MALVEFFCQYCGQRLTAAAGDVSRTVECPACWMCVVVPRPPRRPIRGSWTLTSLLSRIPRAASPVESNIWLPDWLLGGSEHGMPAAAHVAWGGPGAWTPAQKRTRVVSEAAEHERRGQAGRAGVSFAPRLAREIKPGLVEFGCPFCAQTLTAASDDGGIEAVCPVCDTVIVVPRPGEPAQLVDGGDEAEPLTDDGFKAFEPACFEANWDVAPLEGPAGEAPAGDMFCGCWDSFSLAGAAGWVVDAEPDLSTVADTSAEPAAVGSACLPQAVAPVELDDELTELLILPEFLALYGDVPPPASEGSDARRLASGG